MLKKIVLLISLIFILPVAAYATINQALDDFINTMNESTSYTDSGMYSGRKGTYFQGAGMTFKSRVQGPPTFGVTMPTLDAGCNGINFNMGAISIPSEADFVNFVKTVGQNATGYAFKLALNTLAPQVASLLNDIQNFVGKINNMIKNSCNTAQALLNQKNPLESEGIVEAAKEIFTCKQKSNSKGIDTDATKGDIRCATGDRTQGLSTKEQKEQAGYDNYTWRTLKNLSGYQDTQLETLAGLVGMNYYQNHNPAPIIEVDLNMLICGSDKGCGVNTPSSSNVTLKFPSCSSDYTNCFEPVTQDIAKPALGYQVYNYYKTIYTNVITKTATALPNPSIPLTSVGEDVRFKIFLMGKMRSKFNSTDAERYISLYSNLIAAKAVQSAIHRFSLEPIKLKSPMKEYLETKLKENVNNRLNEIDKIVTGLELEINAKNTDIDTKAATLEKAMFKNIAQGRVGFAIMKMRKGTSR